MKLRDLTSVVRPSKPPRMMKGLCLFRGCGTGFETRGKTEHWEYKHGISDFANDRSYDGDRRKGQAKIDYDHGWLDGKELRSLILKNCKTSQVYNGKST